MDLTPNADQIAILDALDSLVRPYEAVSLHATGFALTDAALDRDLAEGGFLDVGFDPELGVGTAALIVERLARLPQASEVALASIVRPLLAGVGAEPLCLVEEGRLRRPLRYLREGARVVVVGAESVTSFIVGVGMARAEPAALFGYPVGTLLALPSERISHGHAVEPLRLRWRIAIAAEAAGLLAAALASVCAHVRERQQFGRAIASFQAVRHRLAEAQVRSNGVYWLAMKAAATLDPADAALACHHAQETARVVVYDFHQFLGGMGMTLEHPLHLWTYRLKHLIGELGGRGANALAAAESLWGD